MSKTLDLERLILDEIREGGKNAQRYISQLYRDHFPKIARFIKKNNGSESDAKDVFQEGMMVFYKQVKQQKFRGDSRIGTYLFSICRYLWYHQLEANGKKTRFELEKIDYEAKNVELPYRKIHQKGQWEWIQKVFSNLAADCKEVLLNALYYQFSMEEIADKMNFESAQIARNKKYKCLKRLRKHLDEHPKLKAILIELTTSQG